MPHHECDHITLRRCDKCSDGVCWRHSGSVTTMLKSSPQSLTMRNCEQCGNRHLHRIVVLALAGAAISATGLPLFIGFFWSVVLQLALGLPASWYLRQRKHNKHHLVVQARVRRWTR